MSATESEPNEEEMKLLVFRVMGLPLISAEATAGLGGDTLPTVVAQAFSILGHIISLCTKKEADLPSIARMSAQLREKAIDVADSECLSFARTWPSETVLGAFAAVRQSQPETVALTTELHRVLHLWCDHLHSLSTSLRAKHSPTTRKEEGVFDLDEGEFPPPISILYMLQLTSVLDKLVGQRDEEGRRKEFVPLLLGLMIAYI